ncbi:ABC-three component system middle component 6 [Hymenobacter cellulosilyticus]|uniref:Uncharacterized protein n=1 Tax=Hymenobacter cellulosilyticus TaxID=2932248 RepID=A0A8T9QG78_9BACT|nr:ABC-three component system middle component 6 [Hymenobacter cellulosilyticus]UOQ75158.1 hypothetical protein MUN79_28635 [Hymenobacter cellulosilyticus]
MILPTKHLPTERALLTIGARLLMHLQEPKSVSRLWTDIKHDSSQYNSISFDWFVLALDLLSAMGTIHFANERIARTTTA